MVVSAEAEEVSDPLVRYAGWQFERTSVDSGAGVERPVNAGPQIAADDLEATCVEPPGIRSASVASPTSSNHGARLAAAVDQRVARHVPSCWLRRAFLSATTRVDEVFTRDSLESSSGTISMPNCSLNLEISGVLNRSASQAGGG